MAILWIQAYHTISTYINSITDLVRKLNAIEVSLSDQEVTDVLIFDLNNEYLSIAAPLLTSKDELSTADVKCIVQGRTMTAKLISIDPLCEYSIQPLCLCWCLYKQPLPYSELAYFSNMFDFREAD